MTRLLLTVPFLMLAVACAKDERPACMAPNESGVILAVNTESGANYGRGGPYPWSISTVTVRMNNGVSRICSIADTDAKMFPVGERVNLALGKRAL